MQQANTTQIGLTYVLCVLSLELQTGGQYRANMALA